MIKFRMFFDKNKEIAWMNEMAEKGYALKKFFAGICVFEECMPGEWEYQIDIGKSLFSSLDDYKAFMKEQEIEVVFQWGVWIILRKKKSENKFELYTDLDSTIDFYSRILRMFKIVTAIEVGVLFYEMAITMNGVKAGAIAVGIITLILFVFIRMIYKTKQTIYQLKEKRGDGIEKDKNKPSPLIMAGLLANSVAFLIDAHVPEGVHLFVQIVAVVLMLGGAYLTMKSKRC